MKDRRGLLTRLDDVSRSAAAQLRRAARRDSARRCIGVALLLTILVPLLAMVTQLVRIVAGAPAGSLFSWWLAVLTFVPAIVLVAARHLLGGADVDRRRALAAIDRRLDSADRLLTADEFLETPERTGFMDAAIADAEDFAERASSVDVTPAPVPIVTRLVERAAVPVGVVLLALAFWLSLAERPVAPSDPLFETRLAAGVGATERRIVDEIASPPEPTTPPELAETTEKRRREDRTRTRATAPVSLTIPEGAERAEGSLGVGETSESDQSSTPSNARGAPSSQGQPSKPGDAPRKRASRPGQRKPDRTQDEQPRRETSEPTGSTAGQGSSKGSNRNPAVSDWSNRDQVNTPDDDQVDDEQDVEDEEEEQESRGGLQPNLRDRRPPVNRDLRIGFGNRSSPDANGRGGPGQQKKSRGVASFVLGVPIPDRVKGQPNPGKTKVTQQRIEPEVEHAEAVTAQPRHPREGAIDPVYHPELDLWLRALVRSYFLKQRTASE